eukprot:TRINITY_DN7729_c0_g3_i2.p1 TRINITY_DN7729_c0_g3~~TRINITY_DN7729_c0_g3_i2.p1  ORF type:complete len:125 (+),score=3.09 TRINITY_DN7729_c0_g3_i2:935-1309(+)
MTMWSRSTLTTQVPICHYHLRSVEEIFQVNTEFDQAFVIQASYYPKLKTGVGYCPLPVNTLDLLINQYPSFKRVIFTEFVYEHTKYYFSCEKHLLETHNLSQYYLWKQTGDHTSNQWVEFASPH